MTKLRYMHIDQAYSLIESLKLALYEKIHSSAIVKPKQII